MAEKKQPLIISNSVSIGLLISAIWAVLVILYFSFGGQNFRAAFETPFLGLLTIISIILPVALIWTAVMTAGTAANVKREALELRNEMSEVSQELKRTTAAMPREQAEIAAQLKRIGQMVVESDKRIKQIANASDPAPQVDVVELNRTVFGDFQAPEASAQISLPLSEPSADKDAPLPITLIIRALNFPRNASDKDGFDALRHAMADRKLRAVLEAAQATISGMSEDEIYLDDIQTRKSPTDAWRKFAEGKRGREVEGLGAIHDKAVLSLVRTRMKKDGAFRDDALEFLRRFDAFLGDAVPLMQGHEITDLSETKSARLFMILARVTGAFD